MPKKLDIPNGSVYGDWVVLSESSPSRGGRRRFICRCSCGVERAVDLSHMRGGRSTGCGCRAARNTSKRVWVHGQANGGGVRPAGREYAAWQSMKDRCFNPDNQDYGRYGGRGITVHPKWLDYLAFFRDMGSRPSPKHSLDRINNDGNYEPGNCKWSTPREQCRNQEKTLWLTHEGRTLTLREWAETSGIPYDTLYGRFKCGRPSEEILFRGNLCSQRARKEKR